RPARRAPRPTRRQSRTGRSRPLYSCSLDERPSGWIEVVLVGAFGELAGDRFAELDPELVEGVDPEQHGVGEGAMLIKGDQRAESARVEPVEQDRRARAIAGIGTLGIIARFALHQGRALGESVEQQQAMVLGILVVV